MRSLLVKAKENLHIVFLGTITEKLVVLFCVETRQVVAALTGQTSHLVNLSFITAQVHNKKKYDDRFLCDVTKDINYTHFSTSICLKFFFYQNT